MEPRIKCQEHGARTMDVPWARKGSGFTLSLEAMVTMLSREMSVSAVARTVQVHENSV